MKPRYPALGESKLPYSPLPPRFCFSRPNKSNNRCICQAFSAQSLEREN